MKWMFVLLVGFLAMNSAQAQEPPPPIPDYPPAPPVQSAPPPQTWSSPPSQHAVAISGTDPDLERQATQWFAIYGFGGVLSKGQKPVGGGIKIARLRWKRTYLTIANLTFAYTVAPGEDAGYFGYFVQSGWKFTAGASS